MYSYRFDNDVKPCETYVGDIIPEGFKIFNGGEPVDWTKFSCEKDCLVKLPELYRSIDEQRAAKWEEIKTERDKREQAGTPYMGKTLDCDEKSIQRITVAVQAAQSAISIGSDFALDWTMQDNSVITMTAAQVCGMSVAIAKNSNGLHKIARELREKIEAATTETDLSAIVWPE